MVDGTSSRGGGSAGGKAVMEECWREGSGGGVQEERQWLRTPRGKAVAGECWKEDTGEGSAGRRQCWRSAGRRQCWREGSGGGSAGEK